MFQVFLSLEILLILTHSTSCSRKLIANALNESCLAEGESTYYDCQAPLQQGSIEWRGNNSGFICPGSNTEQANLIVFALSEMCSAKGQNTVSCGPYFANITCNENGYLSVLSFTANSNMRGDTILCQQHLTEAEPYQQFSIRVGVRPYPPAQANLTFPMNRNIRLDWTPPTNPVIGGIRGYLLYFSPGCGTCPPSELVSNTTFTALCIGCPANGQTCVFEVRTVTEDCGLESTPLRKISIIDDTRPIIISVSILCTEERPRTIHVEWSYIPPRVIDLTMLPEVQGFVLIISENRTSRRLFLPGAQVRDHSFNSSFLQAANLTGNARTIWVVAETAADSIPSESILFSATDELITGIDLSQVLTEHCVQVSISSFCTENAGSFQVQLRFSSGFCGDNTTETTTNNYTLQANYKTCIPTENYSNCFSVVVFNDGVEIGASDQWQLILFECNVSSIDVSGVWLNSTMGRVSQGGLVPHNTQLDIQCNPNCRMLVGDNNTLCVNGTFEPAGDAWCDCSLDKDMLLRIFIFASIPIYVSIIGMILLCCSLHIYDFFEPLFTGELDDSPRVTPNKNRPRPKQTLPRSTPNTDVNRRPRRRKLSGSRFVPLTPLMEEPAIPLITLSPPNTEGLPLRQRKVSVSRSVLLEVPLLRSKQNKLSGSIQSEDLSGSRSVFQEECNTEDHLRHRQIKLSESTYIPLNKVTPANTDRPRPKVKKLSVEVEVHDDDHRPKSESIQLIQIAPANTNDDPRPKQEYQEKLSESIHEQLEVAPNTDDGPRPKQEKLSESIQLIEVSPANTDDHPRSEQKELSESIQEALANTDDHPHPKQKKLSESRFKQIKELSSANTDDDPRPKLSESRSIHDHPRPELKKLYMYRSTSNTDDHPRPKQKKLSESSIHLKEVSPANTDDRPRLKQNKMFVEVKVHNTDDHHASS